MDRDWLSRAATEGTLSAFLCPSGILMQYNTAMASCFVTDPMHSVVTEIKSVVSQQY